MKFKGASENNDGLFIGEKAKSKGESSLKKNMTVRDKEIAIKITFVL